MKAVKRLITNQKGQALIAVIILLLFGGILTTALLGYVSTGLKAENMHEEKMTELYAADAGVEDAIHKIISNYAAVDALEDNQVYPYTLSSTVNDLPVSVNITKLEVLQGLDEEYKTGQPHEGWIEMGFPVLISQTEDYVEYSCVVSANYTGTGSRRVEIAGAFFMPLPGSDIQIVGPENTVCTGVLDSGVLESTENKTILGGFAFLWRWQKNKEPKFDSSNRVGTITFTFKVYDPAWEAGGQVAFFLVREEDISFIASGELSKWLIQASAGNTGITSHVFTGTKGLDIITWEISSH